MSYEKCYEPQKKTFMYKEGYEPHEWLRTSHKAGYEPQDNTTHEPHGLLGATRKAISHKKS